jgi:hypothetical protein
MSDVLEWHGEQPNTLAGLIWPPRFTHASCTCMRTRRRQGRAYFDSHGDCRGSGVRPASCLMLCVV